MDYKYTLIVSQYYHSRIFFLVKFTNDFIQQSIKFISELEDCKRSGTECYEKSFGDFEFRKDDPEIHYRYNVNDEGDIYFLNHTYADKAMYDAINYNMDSYYESREYVRKEIRERIYNHHDYKTVRELVEKYFEIV